MALAEREVQSGKCPTSGQTWAGPVLSGLPHLEERRTGREDDPREHSSFHAARPSIPRGLT